MKMGENNLKHRRKVFWVGVVFVMIWTASYAGGEKGDMSIGLRAGFNRLEGDLNNPALKPFVYGNMNYNLNDFLALGVESGYSILGDVDDTDFKTYIFPYEAHVTLNFFPIHKANIYAILGGGGVYWNATRNNETIRDSSSQKLQKGVDSFFKAGGGIELAINKARNVYFSLGATFRYSLTDMLENKRSGDENDGVLDFYAGLSYYFRTSTRGDKDKDGIPDVLDLSPLQAEDADGYMDHDGKPDGVPHLSSFQEKNEAVEDKDNVPPVVIHSPTFRVEEGKDLKISTEIFENKKLKVASILYRPKGLDQWNVVKLRNMGGILYQGIIPGDNIRKQGLEYCVIAVDEAISGVGYCGLPKRPVNVQVIGNPIFWRLFNGTAALLGWGAASYVILRKQK